MPWVPFTADHVRARLSNRELDAYEATAAANTPDAMGNTPAPSANRMPDVLAQVLARFRGAILSNPLAITMGAAGTLPEFCLFDASVIARAALIGLTPTPEGTTDPRRDELTAARKLLDDLRTIDPRAFGDDLPAVVPESSVGYGGEPLLTF